MPQLYTAGGFVCVILEGIFSPQRIISLLCWICEENSFSHASSERWIQIRENFWWIWVNGVCFSQQKAISQHPTSNIQTLTQLMQYDPSLVLCAVLPKQIALSNRIQNWKWNLNMLSSVLDSIDKNSITSLNMGAAAWPLPQLGVCLCYCATWVF